MSERTLGRRWREALGETPAATIERLRVAAAVRRLAAPDASLKRIAADLGMHERRLERACRRLLGLTAAQWRDLDAATTPEGAMADATIATAYAGSRLIAHNEVVFGGDAGWLLRLGECLDPAAEQLEVTVSSDGWQLNNFVDFVNISSHPVALLLPDGVNRAGVTRLEVMPDRRCGLVYTSVVPPRWCAWTEQAQLLKANQQLAVNEAGDAAEGRTMRLGVGLDLVVEADGSAGYWRAPWPCVLEEVAGLTRGGGCSLAVVKQPGGRPVAGFGVPVPLRADEVVTLSCEPLVAGEWLTCNVLDTGSLVRDAGGLKGVLVAFTIVQTG